MSVVAVEQKRVSRQAREMEDVILSLMLIMTMTAVVEVTTFICKPFCQNPAFDLDSGLEIRILTPSRVELIDKRSILCLDSTTIR